MLLADRSRTASPWVALAVLSTAMLMIILDGTIVSVALPALRADLGFSDAGLSWTVNAYLIPLGGLLLLAGRLGDLVGRRRVLVAGLVLFVLASLACGLATGPAMLVAARAVQGVAAALASSVVLGMVVGLFDDSPDPDADRARAMGAYAFVGAAGASIGLLLGGVLTEALSWRAIFLVNVPIGAVATLLVLRVLPRDAARTSPARPDLLGAVLVTLGLAALVFAIVEPGALRWVGGALAVVLLAGFGVRQVRASAPLVPPRVLRSRAVSLGNLAQVLTVAAMMGFQFATALFLQQVLGYPPAATGLAMTPVAVIIGIVALRVAGPLITRHTARRVLLAGLGLLLAGFAVLVGAPISDAHGTDYLTDLLPALVLLGLGAGLVMPSVTTVVMADATPDTAGLTSGLANTGQQVGGAIGIAVLAAVAAADGFRAAYLVAGTLVLASALVVTFGLRPRERSSAP